MDILISNLNLSLIEVDLQRLFTPYGEIGSVQMIRDKWNNRPTGKAYINMPVDKEAEKAIYALNGTVLAGKTIGVEAS